MWVGSTTLEYVNYIPWGSPHKMRIFFYYSYIQSELGNLGGVKLPTLSARNTVILGIFLEILLNNKNIIENTDTIHNILTIQNRQPFIIRTRINFFLFPKFLPMKVR